MATEASAPQVSIIVRSMARPTLANSLAAIAAQTHPNIEVVLVAACGSSHPVPDDRCGRFPVRFVPSERRLPRPEAANAALEVLRGDWFTFLDDDDTITPDHVAGLVAAHADAPGAGVIHSLARAVLHDGTLKIIGQPFSLMEVYERAYLHLSAALMARWLIDGGSRFDASLTVFEDWDFFIELGQHARFHFVPSETFKWYAEAGDSGTGGGLNHDDVRFAHFRDLVYAKWAARRDALIDRVLEVLRAADAAARAGDYASAAAACREALSVSQNDPWALNLLAMIERATGDLRQARQTQELSVAVRVGDPDLVYNLALLCRDLGDRAAARSHAAKASALAPESAKYRALVDDLSAAAPNLS